MSRGPAVSDRELLERARTGDTAAFESLYVRHAPTVRRYALSLTRRSDDADELVAEVFANLLAALRRGKGPTELVVPYVISSIKHEHWRDARRRTRESVDDLVAHHLDVERAVDRRDVGDEIAEADVIAAALSTLPARSRELLWLAEVEETPPQEIAERDGMTPHAVAVSAHRARRALGSAYLAAHAAPFGGMGGLDEACQDTLADLAPFVRGKVGVRRRRRIERHLAGCATCARNRDRLEQINGRLRHVPQLPLEIGVGASLIGFKAQFVAWLSASTIPVASSGALALAVIVPLALPNATGGTPVPAVAAADGTNLSAWAEPEPVVVAAGSASPPEQDASITEPSVVDLALDHVLDRQPGSDAARTTAEPVVAAADRSDADTTPTGGAMNGGRLSAVGATGASADAVLSDAPVGGDGNGLRHDGGTIAAGGDTVREDDAAAAVPAPPDTTDMSRPVGHGNANGPTGNNGNANGPATNNGQGNANGRANEPTIDDDNRNGNGIANGPTTNNGQGNGNGNANGPTTNNGQGNGNGNANGPTTNNGQGNGNGGVEEPSSHGQERSKATGPAEADEDAAAAEASPATASTDG